MEEDCFGIVQCHGMQPVQCVGGFRNFSKTPTAPTCFGIPQFNVFGESLEFCKSDIVVPLTRMQAKGKKAVDQMIVQEWLPTLPSITVFIS
jgi:hypothetical protein